MSTNALERLVKPALAPKVSYELVEDIKAVLFLVQGDGGLLQCAILDVEKLKVLSIEVWKILAPGDTTALSLANELSRNYPGKFCVDEKGRVDYKLEFFYSDETTPGEFTKALSLGLAVACDVACERYESWMRARGLENSRPTSQKAPNHTSESFFERIKEALHGE